jgi:hypothetical protein
LSDALEDQVPGLSVVRTLLGLGKTFAWRGRTEVGSLLIFFLVL